MRRVLGLKSHTARVPRAVQTCSRSKLLASVASCVEGQVRREIARRAYVQMQKICMITCNIRRSAWTGQNRFVVSVDYAKMNCMIPCKIRGSAWTRQNRFVASVEQVNPIPKGMPGEAKHTGDSRQYVNRGALRSRASKQDAYPTLILSSPPWISTPRRYPNR
jgi:hypothetical protein